MICRENIQDMLSMSVSYYQRKTESMSRVMQISDVLKKIRDGALRNDILEIRRLNKIGDTDWAKKIKGNLPAVTFCATFGEARRTEQCKDYNNLLVIDIDHLNEEEMLRVGKQLASDPYVVCCWKSPSGNGWKGLVMLDYQNDLEVPFHIKHKSAFQLVAAYLLEQYSITLDSSGSDLTRLCFISWDPDFVQKEKIDKFPVLLLDTKDQETAPKIENNGVSRRNKVILDWKYIEGTSTLHNNPEDRKNIERVYKFLYRRNRSITSTYESWVKVAFAISNTFHPVYGRRIFIRICELDGNKHSAYKSEKLIYDAYTAVHNVPIGLGTIIYLAKEQGYVV